MAKGQQRSNKEKRKPKANAGKKAKGLAPSSDAALVSRVQGNG
jgi:hypothetical protein